MVTGRIHNPHYYQWLHRNGGGEAPREPGDIPCGGVPGIYEVAGYMRRNVSVSEATKDKIYEIHRNIIEFEQRLLNYPARPPALYNKELNIRYLQNELTEERWMTLLEHAEAKFNRKKEIGQILQMLVVAAADVMRSVVTALSIGDNDMVGTLIHSHAFPQLESLRVYANESFETLSHSTRMAVPQVGENWKWMPIRAMYRRDLGPEPEETVVEG